jgi:hypothetical protein
MYYLESSTPKYLLLEGLVEGYVVVLQDGLGLLRHW